MSEQSREPGWYQDPFGTGPEDRRYWDGDTWLAMQQTLPAQFDAPGAPAQPQPEPPQSQSAGTSSYDQPAGQGGWGEQQPAPFGRWGQPAEPGDRERTPDGVALASWPRRVVAYLVDALVLGVVSLVVGGALGIWGELSALFESTLQSSTTDATPLFEAFLVDNATTLLAFSFIQLLASGIYHVVLVATRGRTIGKRLMGIRVRLREREGLPIWRAALSRWLLHFAVPNLLSGVPGLGFVAAIFPILDGLWPIWDARRQAIHDKVAKTAVVRG